MTSVLLTSDEFWSVFRDDLATATESVVIVSAFASGWMAKTFGKQFRKLARQSVPICIILQQSHYSKAAECELEAELAYDLRELELVAEMLRSFGAHVNIQPENHSKLVLIDNRIFYEGSINIFSPGRSRNHMRRSVLVGDQVHVIKQKFLIDCPDCHAIREKYSSGMEPSARLPKLGILLSRARRGAKISLRQLSRRSGVFRQQLAQAELGSNIELKTFDRIALELGLEIWLIPSEYSAVVAKTLESHIKE